VKTRRVKNEVWIVMGLCGCVLIGLELILDKRAWEYFLILIPIGILFFSMFVDFGNSENDEKKGINFLPILLYVVGFLVILFFFVLYQAGMLHGGADAKAMMAIAILVPFYPYFSEFPILRFASDRVADAMELFFPFAFLVLMNSVFFIIWVLLGFIVFNATRGDFGFPEMLLGYRMDIDEVEKKFVWPMERIVEGERVMILFPRKTDDESLIKLKEMDVKRIWVTPKIPFIVFITAGFAISVFLGNVFAAMMGLLG
jgi:preflagellin peptidase FlaK